MKKEISILSIIIPHHNTPQLLQRCIDSIPDREDVQIYIVDDNSDSPIVDFGNFPGKERSNTHIFFTKEGRGAGYARNVGLQHAKGDWLLFADSDDFFVPDFYEIVSQYFNSDSEMVLFKAQSVDSETLEPSNRNENINRRIDECLAGNITAKEASIRVQSPWCRLIRREPVWQRAFRLVKNRFMWLRIGRVAFGIPERTTPKIISFGWKYRYAGIIMYGLMALNHCLL